MPFDSEIRRLISCLEPHDSADYMCTGDKQLLDPGEVLQVIGHRSHPSKVGERLGRSSREHDTVITGAAYPYVGIRVLLLDSEGIDHDVLLVEGGDRAREVVGNETTRFDLQTGESLVEDRDESIVRTIMSDASAGRADDIVQHVMDLIVEVGVQLLRVGKVWRPVSLGFFQVVVSML